MAVTRSHLVVPSLLWSNFSDTLFLALLGILTSVYSLYIEVKKAKNPKYNALCDFNQYLSCSRVLSSRYAKGFGVVSILAGKESFLNMPNCVLGLVFYTMQILFACWPSTLTIQLAYYTSIISVIGSLYLAYVLVFVLRLMCFLCITTYITNGALLYLTYASYMLSTGAL